jgi:predicted XRE-type DNA-binding protein
MGAMARAQKRKNDVSHGSGNLYADRGYDHPEEMQFKAKLAILIMLTIKKRGLTQKQAAKIMGLDQPKVSAIINGRLKSISIERLIRYLSLLDVDVYDAVYPGLDRLVQTTIKQAGTIAA